jgi:uncharacterized protein (TIGR00730 family)
MGSVDVHDVAIVEKINQLIGECGGDADPFSCELITQMIQNSLRLLQEKHDVGQLKLMSRSMKEMRYAYRIFNKYKDKKRISIFGSARTPENHPDYTAAQELSAKLADLGWMCITGAANGIMKAGLVGSRKEASFGLSIRLPFEIPTNSVIEGDIKLISFRYFFTRKLMFTSHSDALAAFPGGFGTLDELFEMLTLQQTGKANIVPVVLVEGEGGTYWTHWQKYVEQELLKSGWISPEDRNLYYIAKSPQDAAEHIQKFYHRYHSSRYVKDVLVIRMNSPLNKQQIGALNLKYKSLIASGEITMSSPLPEETDYLTLPRLMFHHTHRDFGLIRALINAINEC